METTEVDLHYARRNVCTSDPGCVRVKWSPKVLRPWTELLGFDSLNTNEFSYDPSTYATWFASNNVWPEPTATPGSAQTFTVSAGITGLTAANFSVKANAPLPSTSTGPAAYLVLAGGNSQTPGTAGQPLANQFIVKVTDGSGNPISGATVSFAVAAGERNAPDPTTATTNRSGISLYYTDLGNYRWNNDGHGFLGHFDWKPHFVYRRHQYGCRARCRLGVGKRQQSNWFGGPAARESVCREGHRR